MFGITFTENSSWITVKVSMRLLQHFVDFICFIGADEYTRLVGDSCKRGRFFYYRLEHEKLGYIPQNIETLYLRFLQRGGTNAA